MNTNNHLRFFDTEFKSELEKKLDHLNTRLKDINESKEEFYHVIKKELIDELFNTIGSSRQIEDIIFKSVSKMESLKQSHEDSAYIHLKIKELSNQQDNIEIGIDQNLNILDDVNNNLKQNISDMKKNIEFVKQRIQKLKSRK
jgi:Dynamitin